MSPPNNNAPGPDGGVVLELASLRKVAVGRPGPLGDANHERSAGVGAPEHVIHCGDVPPSAQNIVDINHRPICRRHLKDVEVEGELVSVRAGPGGGVLGRRRNAVDRADQHVADAISFERGGE